MDTKLYDNNSFNFQIVQDSIDSSVKEKIKKDGVYPSSITVIADVTHVGFVNKNKFYYNPSYAVNAAKSFVTDFNKPVLVNHDHYSSPIGRVIDAKYKRLSKIGENSPSGYIEAKFKISDKDSIKKIIDGLYNTVSIGVDPSEAKVTCSICGAKPRMWIFDDGCEHSRGKKYEVGKNKELKECYWIIDNYNYQEVSYVNIPADKLAQTKEIFIDDSIQDTNSLFEYVSNDSILIIDSYEYEDNINNNSNNVEDNMDDKILIDTQKTLNDSLQDQVKLYKDKYDALKVTSDTQEVKISDLTNENVSLKAKISEANTKIEDSKKYYDEIERYAKEIAISKIMDLTSVIGLELNDEEKNSLKNSSFDVLSTQIKTYSKLIDANVFKNKGTDLSDNARDVEVSGNPKDTNESNRDSKVDNKKVPNLKDLVK